MRITENSMTKAYLTSINGAKERINKLQAQIATNKRVTRPSDDPQASSAIMRLLSGISANEQYQSNVTDARAATAATDTALQNFSSIMQNFNAVIIKATDGTQTPKQLNLQADMIDQLIAEAVGTANSKFNGKFLFGGSKTQTAPYSLQSNPVSPPSQIVIYHGDAVPTQYQVGDGLKQDVALPGSDVFQGTAILDTMIAMRDKLRGVANPAMELSGTLSVNAAVGTSVDMSVTAKDGLGGNHDVVLRWTKSAANAWDVATVSASNAAFSGGTASVSFDPVSGDVASFAQTSPLNITSTLSPAAPVLSFVLQTGALKEYGDTSNASVKQLQDIPNGADRTLVSSFVDSILEAQGKLGTIQQGLDTTLSYVQSQKARLQDMLSSYQDVNVADAALKLKQEESMLDAALAVAARVLPKSLLDYLG